MNNYNYIDINTDLTYNIINYDLTNNIRNHTNLTYNRINYDLTNNNINMNNYINIYIEQRDKREQRLHSHLIITIENQMPTLCTEDISKLNKCVLDHDLEDDCSICLESMKAAQEAIKLDCNHTYHSQCIKTYLTEYNHKCP